jgi:hypothetical protein
MFYWFEPVVYLYPVSKFPETTEKLGYSVVFTDNVGYALTFNILKEDLTTLSHKRVVQSFADANNQNKLVAFKPDEQEIIKRLNEKSSTISRKNSYKQKMIGPNDDVSNRARSEVGHIHQNVGDRTRSKIQPIKRFLTFVSYNYI